MDCRINYNENGNIISVDTPTGERSQLFDRLASIVGKPKALDLYSLTQTEDFKQAQNIKKSQIIDNQKQNLLTSLNLILPKNEGKISILEDGEISNVNLRDIKYKIVDTKQFSTYMAYLTTKKGHLLVGKLRLKPFKNTYKVDQILLSNIETVNNGEITDGKGLGIGTEIFKRVIKDSLKNNRNLYISSGRTEGSSGVISKLKSKGIVTQTVIDGNNTDVIMIIPEYLEPSVEDTINYASSTSNIVSVQEEIEIQNTLSSMSLTSYGQLVQMIDSNLVNEGVLVFTEDSLRNSGLYNDYEIQHILNSIDAQEKIRSIYQRLKASDNQTFDVDNKMFNVPTSKVNNLGKQEIVNPFIIEKEVTSIIAGKDLNVYLDDIPYDTIKNNYKTNPSFKAYLDKVAFNTRNLVSKKIENGELVDKTSNNNRDLFQKTLDLDSRDVLNPAIDYLNTISPNVWNSSLESIYKLLKDFNRKAINSGIDFLDIEDKAYTKSREEILGFIEGFQDLLNNPSENNMDYFFDTYTDFFEVKEEPVKETVETRNENNIYLDTEESEYYLFDNFNLIKESKNVYKQINPVVDLEEAYNILLLNKDKIPSNIETLEELKSYVNELVNEYNNEDFEVSPTQLESMVVHKIYFNSQINTEFVVDKDAIAKYTTFTGDYDYLTTAFASDFYKRYITEKRANSPLFRNFYSNFDITDKGIVLKNNDPITINKVMFYVTEDLQNYNLISKNLNLPLTTDFVKEDITEMQFNREYAISNPKSVPKLIGEFAVVSPETIVVKDEVRPIIKTLNGLYEIDYQTSNNSFYNKLPNGNSNFNSFGQYNSKSNSSVDVKNYTNLDTKPLDFIQAKNFYSKAELQEINKKFFNC